MTAVAYGKLPAMPPSRLVGRELPIVPPLPGPDSPTPRRRRTIICSDLTINGEQWDLEEAAAKMRDALRGDRADIRCGHRPGVQIAADYAADVCLSSWCRKCPFAVAEVKPPPVVRYTIALPDPVPEDRAARDPGEYEAVRTRVVGAIADKRMLQMDIAEGTGWSPHTIYEILTGRRANQTVLDAITRYLALAHPPAPKPPPVSFTDMTPEMHAARILASLKTLGITKSDASRVLGWNDGYVSALLKRMDVPHRLEECDAVLDAMLAAKR